MVSELFLYEDLESSSRRRQWLPETVPGLFPAVATCLDSLLLTVAFDDLSLFTGTKNRGPTGFESYFYQLF